MHQTGATRLAAVFITSLVLTSFVPAVAGQSLDLIYKSVDLIYRVQDLHETALPADRKSGSISNDSSALKGQVTDLKAAGADIKESDTEIKISLQGEILFDFDKSSLRPAAQPTLAQIAALIQQSSKPGVLIEGYTDSKGSKAYNLRLSDRRAASVKTWLTGHGIPARVIQTKGLGAFKPIAPNSKPDGSDDPEGRQQNRRVEITIKK